MFTFYFDNTVVDNPINWDELSEQLERNDELRGLFFKVDAAYTFTGDGFTYLYNKKQADGYCEFVRLQIYKQCDNTSILVFDGNIRLSDCKFNLSKCKVECSIEDNSYGARIFNNKNIKTFVNGGFSKNGIAITPANTYYLYLYEPATNVLDNSAFVNAYDVMDCFQYLVQFMTDGQMNVISSWYSGLPLTEKICVLTGAELRKRQHLSIDDPEICFADLFDEMNKKFNLGMSIETINGVPTLRIEKMSYYYNQLVVASTDNIPDLTEYIDTKNLYSSIKLGSNKDVKYDNTIHSLPPVRFLSFNEEDYIVQGQCNIDRPLDCVSDWIIDSNTIEEVAFTNTNNEGNDEEIFLIQYEASTLVPNILFSVMWNDITTIPPSFFNKVLTNDSVSARWDLQGNIAQYLNATNALFLATQTVPSGTYAPWTTVSPGASFTPMYEPVPFDDDSTPPNFDPTNAYNTTTYRYTANANGIYTFRITQNYTIVQQTYQGPTTLILIGPYRPGSQFYTFDQWRIFSKVYSGATLLRQNAALTPYRVWKNAGWIDPSPQNYLTTGTIFGASYNAAPFFTPNQSLQNVVTVTQYLNAGEEVEFAWEFAYFDIFSQYWLDGRYFNNNTISGTVLSPASNDELCDLTGNNDYIFNNSTVECVGTGNGAGLFKGNDPEDYKVSLFSYEYPLTDPIWTSIKTNPQGAIQFGTGSASKLGWVNRISRNANTGMASIELISNIKYTK